MDKEFGEERGESIKSLLTGKQIKWQMTQQMQEC